MSKRIIASVLALGVVGGITFFASTREPTSPSADAQAAATSHEEAEPLPNWDTPFGQTGIEVSAEALSAGGVAGFDPAPPRGLGAASRMFVNNAADPSAANRAVGWVYSHTQYGRFWVTQQLSQMTQLDLESIATTPTIPGPYAVHSKPRSAKVSVITLASGSRAVLIEGSTATSLMWLHEGLLVRVLGPALSFDRERAIDASNQV